MSQEEAYYQAQMEQAYHEEMQLQHDLDQAAHFLMDHGYMVIPKCDLKKYMGKFLIVPDVTPPKEVDPNDIPF